MHIFYVVYLDIRLCTTVSFYVVIITFASHFAYLIHYLTLVSRLLSQVLPGSMHNMVWKGEEGGDSDDEYSRSTSRMGDEDDDYSSGDSDNDSEVCVLLSTCV